MTYWAHSNPEQPSTDDGQRPCARDTHCAERDNAGQPALGPRAFCFTDTLMIERCLGWFPTAYTMLHMELGETGSGQGERVSSTPTLKVPINVTVFDFIAEIADVLESWAERVRTVADLHQLSPEATRRRRQGVGVAASERTLSAHLGALLALPERTMVRFVDGEVQHWELGGADAGTEIIDLHGKARSMLGLTPKHVDLPVPCWECGLKAVRRWDGSAGLEDQAACSNCQTTYTAQTYTLLMAEVAKQQQATGTRRKASA